MNKALLLFALMLVSSAAFAMSFDAATFFQPGDKDLSAWYLANIFGADLVPGDRSSGIRLLSVLFGIFNQVVLTVAIIIIVYTAMMGTLNTAHEGKPMGDKWNSMWLPVRMSMGIALLVPKGGSGYCLAQTLIMWLTLQGIGAGDQMWNAMLDYFEQGGAIYSNETSRAPEYMTKENLDYTYVLQGNIFYPSADVIALPGIIEEGAKLLKLMMCLELFNTSSQAQGDKYEAYTIGDKDKYDRLYFGSRKCGNDKTCLGSKSQSGVGGYECGLVQSIPSPDGCAADDPSCIDIRNQIYTTANWNMAKGLASLAAELVRQPDLTDPSSTSTDFYTTVNHNAELYINYIVGYEDLLGIKADEKKKGPHKASPFEVYKRYGWILAGNYYTVLSAFKEHVHRMNRTFHVAPTIASLGHPLPTDITTKEGKAYKAADTFFVNFQGTADSSDPVKIYDVPGFYDPSIKKGDKGYEAPISKTGKKGGRAVGIVNMEDIYTALGSPSNMSKSKGKKGAATVSTRNMVQNFIHYLTGVGSNPQDMRVAKDPILRAADYGKGLTISAMILIPILTIAFSVAAGLQICGGITPNGHIIAAAVELLAVPMIALFLFMYAQGAILGVFIPMIPYVTFFIGATGWMLQVVEAIAAAPLVAIGLVFPETKDDIWGKAEPAKMLIFSLFLRPSLMLIGLAAAMIIMWVFVELLNIGFLMLTTITFRIEDSMGFVTIMMAYTAIFTVAVTRAYSLINVVPNKVLQWIAGHGMEVEGAGEAIGAAKGGVQEGAQAVGGGLKAGQDLAASGVGKAKEIKKARDKSKGGTK